MYSMFKRVMNIFKRETVAKEQEEVRWLLTPKILDERDSSYPCVDELRYVIEKTNCKNIALTGVYGSGKSSVIETYLSSQKCCKKTLKISLSTFFDKKDEISKPEDYEQYNAEIEYKIVQHILYKSDPNHLRQSRFERIIHKPQKDIKWLTVRILLAIIAIIVLFEPSFLKVDSLYNLYFKIWGYENGILVNTIADCFAALYLLFFVGFLIYKGILQYYSIRINRVKAKSIEVDFSKNSSVFNQLLDEIVYSFTVNKYDLVLFEDLDRLFKPEDLFLKLRELNMLLNESETFQKSGLVVRFVYAIRDDVFSKDLRTKCFDYIIPVVPVIDRFNASDYLLKHKSTLFQSIDDDTIRDLGVWIVGFRELNNILNEFCLSKKLLFREGMSEGKLLAITIYKNIQPQDYSFLHDKAGLLYNVFTNKQLFTEPFIKEYKDRVTKLDTKIKEDKETVRNIKKRYLDYLVREKQVKTLFADDESYSIDEVLASDILFDKFRKDGFTKYYYDNDYYGEKGFSAYDIKFKKIEEKIGQDGSYEDVVYPLISNINTNNEEMSSLKRSISSIENEGLSVIFNKSDGKVNKGIIERINHSIQTKDNNTIDENTIAFIQAMIRGGYIAEDYPSYVSFYHPGSMLDGDFDFLNAVIQGISKPYNTTLVNPKLIVDRLVISNFNNQSILNFSILNYLMENKFKEHFLEKFIITARQNPEFIVEYCKSKEDPYAFLSILFDNWDYPINDIQAIKDIELQSELLRLFFITSNLNAKLKEDEIEFIDDNYSFINQNINGINIERLKKLLDKYDIKFHSLEPASDLVIKQKALLDYISTSARFDINYENLLIILGKDYETKPFTTISNTNNDELKKYLIDNISLTIKTFASTSKEEERDCLVQLINNKNVDEEWLGNYVAQQDITFDSFDGIEEYRQLTLFKIDKIKVIWDNILDYYSNHTTPDEAFLKFIIRHLKTLAQTKCYGDMEIVRKLNVMLFGNNTNLDFDSFKMLLNCFEPKLSYKNLKNLNEERMVALIDVNKIEYSSDTLPYIKASYSDDALSLFVIKYFDEIDADDDLQWEDYNTIHLSIKILESELTLEQKIKFLDSYATIGDTSDDCSYYASLICQRYVERGVLSSTTNKDLLVSAIILNKESDSWKSKITLVNMMNAYYPYDKDTEISLINSLGGDMYPKLNTTYGRAHFDINAENKQLISYLKEQGHYVKNYNEDNNQIRVSFMSHEP